MLARLLVLLALMFAFVPMAYAQAKIATVDFQRAINEVAEGKAAKQRLEALYAEKKAALDRLQANISQKQADYEKQKVVLSDTARKAKEDEINNDIMAYQQSLMRYEAEFQQAYLAAMDALLQKMRTIAEQIGVEKGYTMVIEITEGGIVYSSPTIDITEELIKRYNAQHPQ
jgi:outer membrane protein